MLPLPSGHPTEIRVEVVTRVNGIECYVSLSFQLSTQADKKAEGDVKRNLKTENS